MSERNNSGKPVWRFPEMWEINSKRGYWKRTVVQLIESEYKSFGLKVDTQRYINPHGDKQTRTDADVIDNDQEGDPPDVDATGNNTRLYPDGKRLSRGEATKARFHAPQDEHGGIICWDFNSHAGCFRGVTCANSHVRMKPGPSHRCPQAELIRRGGNRRYGELIPVREIDGMVRQLREQSKKEEDEKRVSGETKPESATNYDVQNAEGDPAIPKAPEGFGDSILHNLRTLRGNCITQTIHGPMGVAL